MSTASTPPADGAGIHALLASTSAVRLRARRDRQGWWLPLVVFGVAEAAALPVYLTRTGSTGSTWQPVAGLRGAGLWGVTPAFGPGLWSGAYWLLALPLAYALTWWWYSARSRRTGLASPVLPFTATGLVLLGLLVLSLPVTASALHLPLSTVDLAPLDLTARGLVPQMVVAAGLVVLAATERSRVLGVVVLAYTALAVVANLYNVENLYYRAGGPPLGSAEMALNVLVPPAVLLAAGLAAGARRHWR